MARSRMEHLRYGGSAGGGPLRFCGSRPDELQRLLPLWPGEIDDTSLDGLTRLVAKLERALKAERRRGRAGHWAYDLARHTALLRAWRREQSALASLRCSANKKGAAPETPPS